MAGMVVHYESGGNEMVYFGRELELLAVVAISDPIRFTSFDAVKELRDMGLEVCMLTGDGERTAHSVASRLGIDYFIADALPEEKAEFVSELQRKGKKVAVVGDGGNDRQALASADVSIAMSLSPEAQKNPKEQQVQEGQEGAASAGGSGNAGIAVARPAASSRRYPPVKAGGRACTPKSVLGLDL